MKNYRTEIAAAVFLALLVLSILLASPWRGISPQPSPTAGATPSTEITLTPSLQDTPAVSAGTTKAPRAAQPGDFPTCSEPGSRLCLVSVGLDALSGGTVFSLNLRDTGLNEDVYLLVTADTTTRYDCQSVESLPNVVYCSGPFIFEGTRVNIEVYARTSERLLASGALIIPADFSPSTDHTPTPLYPSYPSYP